VTVANYTETFVLPNGARIYFAAPVMPNPVANVVRSELQRVSLAWLAGWPTEVSTSASTEVSTRNCQVP
jgi:hypothetical protein